MPSEKQATLLRLRCFDCGGRDFEMVVENDGFMHRYVRIICVDCRREYRQVFREYRQVFVAGKRSAREAHMAEADAQLAKAESGLPMLNAAIAKLVFMTHGEIGCDWRSGRRFVLFEKGNEFVALREAADVLCRIRSLLAEIEKELRI